MRSRLPSIWPLAVLLAVVVALLALIAGPASALPAGAQAYYLGVENNASADWSTTQAKAGRYSAHLQTTGAPGAGDEARVVIPLPAGTTLGDIDTISWYEYLVAGYPPHVDILLDVDGGDALVFEYAYNDHYAEAPMPYGALPGGWYQTFSDDGNGPVQVDGAATGWLSSGPPGPPGEDNFGTLAEWKAGITYGGVSVDSSTPVLRLEIEVDNWVVQSEAYVDDVTINGVLYELEPVALDSDFYHTSGSVAITVVDAAANADPIRTEQVTVDPTSDTDVSGIEVTLVETGVNTGVFVGTFPLVAPVPEPGLDELGVQDGDDITVTYTSTAYGEVNGIATVDDADPVVTITAPDDGDLVKGEVGIVAEVEEPNSDTAVVNIDGVEQLGVTYAPPSVTYSWDSSAVGDGTHTIQVVATDEAGNTGSHSIAVTVDNTAPTLTWIMWEDVDGSADISAGDTLTFTFSEEMDTTTITHTNIATVLPTSAAHSYGALTADDLIWNDPVNDVLVVVLGIGTNIEANETVDPKEAVTDVVGNPDVTEDPGPPVVQVTVRADAPAIVLPTAAFDVPVNITDVSDFDAASYNVMFNSAVLELTSVTAGTVDTTPIPVGPTSEIYGGDPEVLQGVRVVQNVSEAVGVSGSGTLAVLHFTFIGNSGEGSYIDLVDGTLSDKDANEIYVNWFGDSVVATGLVGDANGDGELDALDITTIELIVAGIRDETPGADANLDGELDALDITSVEILVAGG